MRLLGFLASSLASWGFFPFLELQNLSLFLILNFLNNFFLIILDVWPNGLFLDLPFAADSLDARIDHGEVVDPTMLHHNLDDDDDCECRSGPAGAALSAQRRSTSDEALTAQPRVEQALTDDRAVLKQVARAQLLLFAGPNQQRPAQLAF